MGETHTRRDTKEVEVGAMKLTREIYDGTRGMSPLAGSLTRSRLIRTSSACQLPPWEAVVTYCSEKLHLVSGCGCRQRVTSKCEEGFDDCFELVTQLSEAWAQLEAPPLTSKENMTGEVLNVKDKEHIISID